LARELDQWVEYQLLYGMIITEEMLSPHRSKSGFLSVQSIPPELFTETHDAFRPDWPDPDDMSGLVEAGAELPIVLVFAFAQHVPVLKSGREWLALSHQSGGLLCEHQLFVATRLKPRSSVVPPLQRIAREGFGAENGRFSSSDLLASRIANYVAELKRIAVDCECTWPYLTESVYPIDATNDNLARVAEDAPTLGDLAVAYEPARFDNNPVILCLTENSD
jgi:hypothetical protein